MSSSSKDNFVLESKGTHCLGTRLVVCVIDRLTSAAATHTVQADLISWPFHLESLKPLQVVVGRSHLLQPFSSEEGQSPLPHMQAITSLIIPHARMYILLPPSIIFT